MGNESVANELSLTYLNFNTILINIKLFQFNIKLFYLKIIIAVFITMRSICNNSLSDSTIWRTFSNTHVTAEPFYRNKPNIISFNSGYGGKS